MRYISKDSTENFEFHDSFVKSADLENGILNLIVQYLNIHKGLPENPNDCDMEIEEAKITLTDFSLKCFTFGGAWQIDENGNSYQTESVTECEGEEGLVHFKREIDKGFTILDWYTSDQENELIYNIEACGDEPFFDVSFSASSITIEWDSYRKKAWYELKRWYDEIISLIVEDKEVQSNIHLSFDDEDENDPTRAVGVEIDNQWIWGHGDFMPDAVINLEEQLLPNIKLKCCQTCRYGNCCPCGNDEEHIFCLQNVSITSKAEVYHYIIETDTVEIRKHKWYACCEKYQPMQEEYYTYNDYYKLLFDDEN